MKNITINSCQLDWISAYVDLLQEEFDYLYYKQINSLIYRHIGGKILRLWGILHGD